MSQATLRRIYLRLAGMLMLVVIVSLGVSAYLSHRMFEESLTPLLSRKVSAVGSSLRSLVLKAVDHHVEFSELYGVDQKFDEIKKQIPEIAYFAITDTRGKVLHQALRAPAGATDYFRRGDVLGSVARPQSVMMSMRVGDQYMVSMPIVGKQGPLGFLHLGVEVKFVDNIVLDMLFDVLVVLVVALFFTLELLHFLAGDRLERSLKSLGDTLDRGISGQFAFPARTTRGGDFVGVTRLLDAVLERVNASFEALSREVDALRRLPTHERPAGLEETRQGLAQLGREYRFGRQSEAEAPRLGQIGKVRAPLFIFILAEEMTRSFLPGYVKSLLVPLPWLSAEIVVGVPITLFMLIVALAQPYLGASSERVGHRRMMLYGAAITAAGFATTAFASSVFDLLIWRSLCAIGYAMVFVAAQGYVLENAAPSERARSFAVFVGAIMVATICGPSIGGILADNIGERMTFGVSALLALGSMLAMRQMPGHQPRPADAPVPRAPTFREIGALLVNRRFMSVTGLAAMPAKIVLTGICFYLIPLYMISIGGSQAMTGRMLMSYAVVMVVMSPWTATLARTRDRMEWLVGGGLALSGVGGLLLLGGGGVFWVFAAILLIGFGQSLSMSAQSALVAEHCTEEVAQMGGPAVYGVYRLLERLGNALGPMLAGVLVMSLGYRNSFAVIGALALFCGATFLVATHRDRSLALAAA